MIAGVVLVGCSRETPPTAPTVAPTVISQPSTPSKCAARDATGRTVRFLPTVDVTAPPAQGDEACALAKDLIALLHEETQAGVANICEVFDQETPESQAHLRSMAMRASTPEQLRFAKAVSMCVPENRDQTVKDTLRAPAIYSAGNVQIAGRQCRAYLFVMEGVGPMLGSTVYRPRLLDDCSAEGRALEDRAFMPEQRPTAPLLGDLLREIGYTGRLPETFQYKNESFAFVSPTDLKPASAATEIAASAALIPARFHGVWVDGEEGCKRYKEFGGPDPGAIVSGTLVYEYELGCNLKAVSNQSGDVFKGEFQCSQEGDEYTRVRSLRRDGPDLILDDQPTRFTYCEAAPPEEPDTGTSAALEPTMRTRDPAEPAAREAKPTRNIGSQDDEIALRYLEEISRNWLRSGNCGALLSMTRQFAGTGHPANVQMRRMDALVDKAYDAGCIVQ